MSEDYEEIFSSLGGRLISLYEIEELLSLLGHPSKRLILDFGTGTGRIARHLLKFNNEVVGIDISSERLKLASKKAKKVLKEKSCGYFLVKADGHYLPFKDKAFHDVISIRTLKYLENTNLAFFEIARVLKCGGVCVLELSNIFGYENLWLFLRKLLGAEKYAQNMGKHYRLFNIFRVKKALRDVNLILVSEKAWHKIPTIIFINCKQFFVLKVLFYIELFMQKFLPTSLLSRGVLVKCVLLK